MIAVSVSPPTRSVADDVAERLRALGHAVELYADGVSLEAVIRAGTVTGAIELGLAAPLPPERLTAAAIMGVPQLIALVGLTGSPALMDALGKAIAEKASAARGPTAVLIPPDADAVLVESLRNWIYPPSLVLESISPVDDSVNWISANRLE